VTPSDIARQALNEYLNIQGDVLASRAHFSTSFRDQIKEMEAHILAAVSDQLLLQEPAPASGQTSDSAVATQLSQVVSQLRLISAQFATLITLETTNLNLNATVASLILPIITTTKNPSYGDVGKLIEAAIVSNRANQQAILTKLRPPETPTGAQKP